MTEPGGETRPMAKWLWIILIILLFILAILWFADPFGKTADVEPAPPQPPSTEWTEAPEGKGVDVTLPETRLKEGAAEPDKGGESPADQD